MNKILQLANSHQQLDTTDNLNHLRSGAPVPQVLQANHMLETVAARHLGNIDEDWLIVQRPAGETDNATTIALQRTSSTPTERVNSSASSSASVESAQRPSQSVAREHQDINAPLAQSIQARITHGIDTLRNRRTSIPLISLGAIGLLVVYAGSTRGRQPIASSSAQPTAKAPFNL